MSVGMKRALTPSDEDGEEKKGESDDSAMEAAPPPCAPPGLTPKQEKLRAKRRRRKERRKATGMDHWLEEADSYLPDLDDYDLNKYCSPYGERYGM
jgi:hypothetical protein